MKVGVLADTGNDDGSIGGAELSIAELCEQAPKDVEIVPCPVGEVVEGLDRYLIGNCVRYTPEDIAKTRDAPRTKRIADVWPNGLPEVREELLTSARLVFSSPLHVERFPHDIDPPSLDVLPAPIDIQRFRLAGGRYEREGTVWLGSMQLPSKGMHLAEEWAEANEQPIDFYGHGAFAPAESEWVHVKAPVKHRDVPKTLARYERFVFLPLVLEPFGRAVAEAWAAGCKLTVNRNIGALHWIENDPGALETAAEDFWEVVLR